MRTALAALATMSCVLSTVATAQALWTNNWLAPAAPTLYGYYPDYPFDGLVVFSPNGEALVRTPSTGQLDDELVRVAVDGTVRWRANIGNIEIASVDGTGVAMLANSDGSAVVAAQYGAAVVKLDASGKAIWATAVPAKQLAQTYWGQIIAFSCNVLSGLDASSGQIRWQYVYTAPTCSGTGMAVSNDSVYASFQVHDASTNTVQYQIMRFDESGDVLWTTHQDVTPNDPLAVLGASSDRVYLSDASNTRALATQDGTLAWSASGWRFVGIAGLAPEPILSGSNGSERVAEADGAVRWIQPSATGRSLTVLSTSQFILSGALLEADSGNIDWIAPSPGTDDSGKSVQYFAFGRMSDGSILGAAGASLSPAPVVLQRMDPATGAQMNRIALGTSPQALTISNSASDATRVFSVGSFAGANGTQIRLRSVARSDGSTTWETVDETLSAQWSLYPLYVTTAGDAVAVAVGANYEIWIASYDAATGAKRWSQTFSGLYSAWPAADTQPPLADSAGNLLVSFSVPTVCPGTNTTGCNQLTVAKLDHGDGHVVWRHDDVLSNLYLQQNIFLVGTDVLVNGAFNAPDETTVLMKLAGSDGSVQWRSSDANFTLIDNAYPAPDGNMLLAGGGWGEVNLQDGTTLWHSTAATNCNFFSAAQLPNGDMVGSGYTGLPSAPSQPCIVKFPASANSPANEWMLDAPSTIVRTRSGMPHIGANGKAWIRIRRQLGTTTLPTFVQFDAQSGTLVGEQALSLYSSDDPMTSWLDPVPLEAPADGVALALTYSSAPQISETMGIAAFDITPVAHGDLALNLSVDRNVAAAGDVLGFHATVSYSGDSPVSGAKLMLSSPWKTHATAVACAALSASNCSMQTDAADFVATFDIQSGGQVDISGQFPALAIGKAGTFTAVVAGPPGLVETNVLNNFGKAVVLADQIFRDSFD